MNEICRAYILDKYNYLSKIGLFLSDIEKQDVFFDLMSRVHSGICNIEPIENIEEYYSLNTLGL